MKFSLKDYQQEAVDLLLERLERAQSDYRTAGTNASVSLCATTGAGKTVISAAVIEALFYGSGEFEPDPGAVVVWFSDDPSLNQQSLNRLHDASDKISRSDLVTIEPPFDKPRLEPGKVYFLNTQKLSVSSKLTRGARDEADPHRFEQFQQPDAQAWTIWDTLTNTILDEELTLYLFLDEAHRGFGGKGTSKDKATIVKRLVNGSVNVAPAPIVVGISATIGKFSTAMTDAEFLDERQALPPVNVDAARVQESGLIKDTVVLDFTTEEGVFSTALVRRAAEKLRASTDAWMEYATQQDDPTALVVPLLVLQIPNKPDHDEVGRALDVVAEVMPSITQEAVRHVLGDHTAQEFGSWVVNWMEPQLVQERTDVRVLVAKEAISTGWDCPRAEVMVSFRTAKESDHITQILGRMVRNPLARRIPGDERLNSVDCLLPHFDRTTAGKVVKFITGQTNDLPGAGKRVLLDGRELDRNGKLEDADAVWEAWRGMPTQLLPQRGSVAVGRLLALATELSRDKIRPGAVAEAEEEVLTKIDGAAIEFGKQVAKAREGVLAVHGQSISGTTGGTKLTYADFVMAADDQAVAVAYGHAISRAFSDVARAYVERAVKGAAYDPFDSPLRTAMVEVAALGHTPEVRRRVDQAANDLFDAWEYQHSEQIQALSDLRREAYRDIKARAAAPQVDRLIKPRVRLAEFEETDENGQTTVAELVERHLMADENGHFPLSGFNAWERKVVKVELARPGTVAWYRNPPRSSGDSLCIAYRNEVGNWRGLYPDFVFFERVDGVIRPSIIDPHRHDLDDTLLKLRALARFAKEFGEEFHRIESLSEINGKMRRLDLKSEAIRKHVDHWAKDAVDLYATHGVVSDPAPQATASAAPVMAAGPVEQLPFSEE